MQSCKERPQSLTKSMKIQGQLSRISKTDIEKCSKDPVLLTKLKEVTRIWRFLLWSTFDLQPSTFNLLRQSFNDVFKGKQAVVGRNPYSPYLGAADVPNEMQDHFSWSSEWFIHMWPSSGILDGLLLRGVFLCWFHILKKMLETCVSVTFPDFQRQMERWQRYFTKTSLKAKMSL